MSNFDKVLAILSEKTEVTDEEYLDFGEDFNISMPKKLFIKARNLGLVDYAIADLYKKKS